jgi:transcriptional regulator with XRE-family HTH domain
MLDIGSTISSKEVVMAYKIKEIREKKRMSQAELAEISGVSRATIIRVESADNVVINTKTLEKLASALGVSVRTLFLT